MTISEESRHRLYERLEEVLGREQATILMEHLPPVGRADLATKRDLDALAQRMELRFDVLGNQLRAEWRHDLMNVTFAMLAANATLAALAFGAARLV